MDMLIYGNQYRVVSVYFPHAGYSTQVSINAVIICAKQFWKDNNNLANVFLEVTLMLNYTVVGVVLVFESFLLNWIFVS